MAADNIKKMTKVLNFVHNLYKTKYIIFHTRRPFSVTAPTNLTINGEVLSRTSEIKYLGIILDEHLSWMPHLNKIKISLSRAYYILKKLSATKACCFNSCLLPDFS